MSEQEKRLGLNEAMFREINERLEAQLPTDRNNRLSILCECADPDCTTRIEITPDEYEPPSPKPPTAVHPPRRQPSRVSRAGVCARAGKPRATA